jgi:hypothetical protein
LYDYKFATTRRIFGVENMKLIFILFFLLALSVVPAYSYLDPGAGSMLAQLIMGGVAGLVVLLKLYWGKFKSIFVKVDSTTPEKENYSQTE